MGYTCAPQIMGLVRAEPKPGQRHRANGKAILSEAGKERWSASETLDRTRSDNNVYAGYESGFACWDAICDEAERYRVPTKLRNGVMAERGLRKDAVIGFAVIFNPPHEMTIGWTQDDYRRFYDDSWRVLEQIEPDLFRDANVRMDAVHRDEGRVADPETVDEHLHRFGVCKDRDGKYCGNKIDAKLLIRINEQYPKMMRERGWELEDLDMTDWERMKTDEDYRRERNQKRKERGRSTNQYIRDDLRKQRQRAIDLGEEALSLKSEYEAKEQEASELLERAQQTKEDADEYSRRTRKRADEDAKKVTDEATVQASRQRESAVRERQQAELDATVMRQQALQEIQRQRIDLDEKQKEQDKREAEFQVHEDSLETQGKALEKKEADLQAREKNLSADEAKIKMLKSQAQKDRKTAQETLREAREEADQILEDARRQAERAERERQTTWEVAKAKIKEMFATTIEEMKKSAVADPPQDLAQYAKGYTRMVPKRGAYNQLTGKFDNIIGPNGQVVKEQHNCFDDWEAEVASKRRRGDDAVRKFHDLVDGLPERWDGLSRTQP